MLCFTCCPVFTVVYVVAGITLLALCAVWHTSAGEAIDSNRRFLSGREHFEWGPWTQYSACQPACPGGNMYRSRDCFDNQKGGTASDAYLCPGSVSKQTRTCDPSDCTTVNSACVDKLGQHCNSYDKKMYCQDPYIQWAITNCQKHCGFCSVPAAVDGDWGPWSPYTMCSHTCGSGTSNRRRQCNNPAPSGGGRQCPGYGFVSIACNVRPCTVDGAWSDWGPWSDCSTSCDLGTITRIRTCDRPAPQGGGHSCAEDSKESHECSKGPCPTWSHWFEGKCSVSCGNGTMERLRHCSTGLDTDCGGKAYELVPCSSVTCV